MTRINKILLQFLRIKLQGALRTHLCRFRIHRPLLVTGWNRNEGYFSITCACGKRFWTLAGSDKRPKRV